MEREPTILEIFAEAGVLSELDTAFARRMSRLADESSPAVQLAAALACRAPRVGHICVDLHEVRARVASELDETAPPLPWPNPDAWVAEVASSRLTTGADTDTSERESSPLQVAGPRVYLRRYLDYESRLAGQLLGRIDEEALPAAASEVRAGMDALFGPAPTEPDRQRIAAAMALTRRFMVLSGGPGTGKTTVLRKIVALLVAQQSATDSPMRVLMLAPTGKAASRLTEALSRPDNPAWRLPASYEEALATIDSRGRTIHGALGVRGNNLARFWRDADNPLAADVVIVDEASMVHFGLMTRLLEAVPPKATLILVGDPHQLASVEAGAVLGDICAAARNSGGLTQPARKALELAGAGPLADTELADWWVHLTKVHRQKAADSGIVRLAAVIRTGAEDAVVQANRLLAPTSDGGSPHVHRVALSDKGHLTSDIDALLIDEHAPLLAAVKRDDPEAALDALERFRVLCAHRTRGPLSVRDLETRIVRLLRQAHPRVMTTDRWYVGRPILITQSDRDLGLFNGDSGVILRDKTLDSGRIAVFRTADGTVRRIAPGRLPSHETVFATTIHKSQGSQFDRVLIALPPVPSKICTRELLYTGLTRAKDQAWLAATDATLAATIAQPVQRFSGLRERLAASVEV